MRTGVKENDASPSSGVKFKPPHRAEEAVMGDALDALLEEIETEVEEAHGKSRPLPSSIAR